MTDIEGRIRIVVRTSAGQVADVNIESSRPQLAQRIMAGRTPAEAAELAGLLFSLCGRAQRIAARIACAAAGADDPSPDLERRHILAEWTREHAWRLLLNWPEASGLPADPSALQTLHRAGEATEPLAQALDALLANKLLGEDPKRWLARDWGALLSWLQAGQGAAALFDTPFDGPDPGACGSLLLPPISAISDTAVADLARQALDDPPFCAQPRWHGVTVETGALARTLNHPLVAAWLAQRGQGTDARLLARLVELAELPARLRTGNDPVYKAWRLADDIGVAAVETSRGVLIHIARLDGGRVADYRIISPTEWNFHPTGPLAEAMRRLPVDGRLIKRAQRLALAFDPCVDYVVEVEHA